MNPNNDTADLATIVSIFSAFISITDIQPVVTLCASLVAIISGLFAVRYYYFATKKVQK